MHILYAHMIGVKFHHIKIREVLLLGIENWSTVQNVQNGNNNIDPASGKWLTKNKDTASDDILGGLFKPGI